MELSLGLIASRNCIYRLIHRGRVGGDSLYRPQLLRAVFMSEKLNTQTTQRPDNNDDVLAGPVVVSAPVVEI